MKPVAETLAVVESIASDYGITRVTDTTRLDYIGCPVFASVRPAARSLCVNAGKGYTALEARVGAYMEALEYALAEPEYAAIPTFLRALGSLEDGLPAGLKFLDFCPIFGRTATRTSQISALTCEELNTRRNYDLPAELVLHPTSALPGEKLFGSSTNGLASGNTVPEASVHAIFEILERDVMSFARVSKNSSILRLESLSTIPAELVSKINASGLSLVVRYEENSYSLPYFEAFLIDDDATFPNISTGQGLHYSSEIALVRAITESVQSRLTHIHGGRDDLSQRLRGFSDISSPQRLKAIAALSEKLQDKNAPAIDLTSVPSRTIDGLSADELLDQLRRHLESLGTLYIFRAVLSPSALPLAVVKMVIPGMEHLEVTTKRLGPRLLAHVLND